MQRAANAIVRRPAELRDYVALRVLAKELGRGWQSSRRLADELGLPVYAMKSGSNQALFVSPADAEKIKENANDKHRLRAPLDALREHAGDRRREGAH